MSEGNGHTNGETDRAASKPICYECGRVFKEKDQARKTIRDYNLTAKGVICRNQPECRGRILHAKFEELGLKRWSPTPQERLLQRMDCPPKGWDPSKKWESVNESADRVEAAIEFFSTCWPVCLFYAVQTDEEGEPLKDRFTGDWKHHTTRSLAEVLAVSQMTVVRAIFYLKQRHRVCDDEGRYGLDLAPKSLSVSERESCTRMIQAGNGFGALLPSDRKFLDQEIAAASSPESCTRLKEIAAEVCTGINSRIAEARAWGSVALRESWNGNASLLSRLGEGENGVGQHSSSSSTVQPIRAHDHIEPEDDDAKPPLNEEYAQPKAEVEALHAAGLGRGALAKLPSPRPVLPDPEPPLVSQPRSNGKPAPAVPADEVAIVIERAQQYFRVDEDWGKRLIAECRKQTPDVTAAEVAHFIDQKWHQVKGRNDIRGMAGFLMECVPKMCVGNAFQSYRLRQREEEERRRRREESDAEWTRRFEAEQRAVLADPNASEEAKHDARIYLGIEDDQAEGVGS